MLMNSGEYLDLVQNIKQEIQSAQYRAALNVNRELICLYYDIGSAINEHKTWGNKFIENLATDIRLAFPEAKGYSVRNLKYMAKFAEAYSADEFVQQPVAQSFPSDTATHCIDIRNHPAQHQSLPADQSSPGQISSWLPVFSYHHQPLQTVSLLSRTNLLPEF